MSLHPTAHPIASTTWQEGTFTLGNKSKFFSKGVEQSIWENSQLVWVSVESSWVSCKSSRRSWNFALLVKHCNPGLKGTHRKKGHTGYSRILFYFSLSRRDSFFYFVCSEIVLFSVLSTQKGWTFLVSTMMQYRWAAVCWNWPVKTSTNERVPCYFILQSHKAKHAYTSSKLYPLIQNSISKRNEWLEAILLLQWMSQC